MKNETSQLLNVQKAALFLGVSSATIRQWAQSGKIKGIKVGSRGDWRFTKEELSTMIQVESKKFTMIKNFLLHHASTIQSLSTKIHKEYLGVKGKKLQESKQQKKDHTLLVKEFANNLDDLKKGILLFESIGEKLAKQAIKDDVSLEEAIDGILFLKQAFWQKLEEQELLYKLSTKDLYSFSHVVTTYSDIVAAKLAFAYHDFFQKEEKRTEQERKDAHERLVASEERYKSFIKLSTEGIWRFELEKPIPVKYSLKKQISMMYKYAYLAECNDATARMYGYKSAKDIVGARLGDFLVQSDVTNIEYLKAFVTSGYSLHDTESREVDKRGNTRYFTNSLIGFVENGVVKRAWGVQRDITKQKQAQKELEDIRVNYSRLIDSNIIGIVFAGIRGENFGKFIDANDFFLQSFGYSREELQSGKVRWDRITPPEYEYLDKKALNELEKKGECVPYEKEYITKSGKRVPILLGIAAIPNTDICIAYILDISRQKQLEKKTSETAHLLEHILQRVPVGIFQTDKDGNCIYVNKKWSEFAGMSFNKARGQGWVDALHPDDKERVTQEWYKAAENKQDFSSDYRFLTRGKVTWVHGNATAMLNAENNVVGYLGTIANITERKILERQKDDFLGIASHELKTPVTSLKAYGQVLQNRFKKIGDDSSAALLLKMDSQINKLTHLIGDLLDVTKIEGGRLQFHEENFSFDELVDEVVEQVQRTTEKHQIKKTGKTGKITYGDRERIGQVITNFLTNAIKYSQDAKEVIVTSSTRQGSIRFSVQDFGIGIPQDKLPLVFERFYRVSDSSHDTVPGIGLGLFISKEIITRQKGTIWAESTLGKGSIFYFRLPIRNKRSTKRS